MNQKTLLIVVAVGAVGFLWMQNQAAEREEEAARLRLQQQAALQAGQTARSGGGLGDAVSGIFSGLGQAVGGVIDAVTATEATGG